MGNFRIATSLILYADLVFGLVSGCSISVANTTGDGGPDASGSDASGSEASGQDAGSALETGGPGDTGPESGSDASCQLPDAGSGIPCAGHCVDFQTDPANCGGCNLACEAGALCSASSCSDVAGVLNGLRWELPCTSSGNICPTVAKVTQSATLKGATGRLYEVTLRFRGVVEEEPYNVGDAGDGGTAVADGGSNPQLFQIGGSPVNTSANVYELDVDQPAQTFFLNSGLLSVSYVVPIDYVATIPMQGGARLTLIGDPVDGLEYSNHGQDGGAAIPPGVPPAPSPYDGQFVQMDVVSVVAK